LCIELDSASVLFVLARITVAVVVDFRGQATAYGYDALIARSPRSTPLIT
jgi:hypothetical protein